jgi:uncharacterized protein (TIGR00369 family)
MRDAARKPPSTRLGEAASGRAGEPPGASAGLDDAPHRLRPPSCPADRPRDLYGSLSTLLGITQQHGFFHAGITSTIADTAGGYAAYSLMPAGASVLTTEFKINLLAPADGELLRARGRVVKPGRTLTVCDVDVFAVKDGRTTPCAKLLETLMCLEGRPDGPV